jgi:hypothetical protein
MRCVDGSILAESSITTGPFVSSIVIPVRWLFWLCPVLELTKSNNCDLRELLEFGFKIFQTGSPSIK